MPEDPGFHFEMQSIALFGCHGSISDLVIFVCKYQVMAAFNNNLQKKNEQESPKPDAKSGMRIANASETRASYKSKKSRAITEDTGKDPAAPDIQSRETKAPQNLGPKTEMEVIITTMVGTVFNLRCHSYETVKQLKQRIEEEKNIKADHVFLTFLDKNLNDCDNLRNLGITDGSNLRLTVRMAGGLVN
jgi:uncharacterized ubiquitin-like protein YukD